MPTGAVLLLRLPALPNWGEPNCWRRDILTEFKPDAFKYDGPLKIIEPADRWGPMLGDNGTWFDVGVCEPYFGKGYERGDLRRIVRVAEWLENRVADSECWYGHDASDASERFGAAERDLLMRYFNHIRHDPHDTSSSEARNN